MEYGQYPASSDELIFLNTQNAIRLYFLIQIIVLINLKGFVIFLLNSNG